MRTVEYITEVKTYLSRNKLNELYARGGYKDFHLISKSVLVGSFIHFCLFLIFFEDFSDFSTIYIGISTNQSG